MIPYTMHLGTVPHIDGTLYHALKEFTLHCLMVPYTMHLGDVPHIA